MDFKRGDVVRATKGMYQGKTFTITEIRGGSYNPWAVGAGVMQGVYVKNLELVAPVTLKLEHKTNGSNIQIVVSDGSENAESIHGVIDGTTEPVVTFVAANWNKSEVAPPFVFPTKRGAIIESAVGNLFVLINGAGSSWRGVSGNGIYQTSEFGDAKGYEVIFEGVDE